MDLKASPVNMAFTGKNVHVPKRRGTVYGKTRRETYTPKKVRSSLAITAALLITVLCSAFGIQQYRYNRAVKVFNKYEIPLPGTDNNFFSMGQIMYWTSYDPSMNPKEQTIRMSEYYNKNPEIAQLDSTSYQEYLEDKENREQRTKELYGSTQQRDNSFDQKK